MAWAAFGEPEFEPNFPLSWTRGEYVGAGSYGKVYKCHLRINNDILAVKIVQMEPQAQKEVEALNNEIRILKKLRHERIVSYYGNEQKDDQLHLFMEFMARGSLSDEIKRDGVLSEHLSKRYTKQMLEGVCFLHSRDIIHRDIKGSNVLLDSRGNVKLADFGLSKMIEKVGSKTNLATSCGTSYWMAPEILWGQGYGRKADIWSLGCTVVEMLTGKPPLGDLNPHAAMFSIGNKPLDLTLPERVSNEAKRFIEAALTWKPDNRPWSHELQRHAFISNRNEIEERSFDLEAAFDPYDQESLESVNDAQLHNLSLPPAPLSQSLNVRDGAIADNMEQQRSINWSALSQRQKYSTKVLEMPFPLLLQICITLDIQRFDGKDFTMLAYKLGISVPGELAFLKQAASTQPPDNNYLSNSISYVVLSTKSSLVVRGFVSIMEEIERDDIIHLINNWSN